MNCVVCQSPLGLDIAVIGDQFPSAIYLDNITEQEFGLSKSSLNLSQCLNLECNLVQLSEPINLDLVYKHYPYQSGTTATMHSILSSVVNEALSYQRLNPGDVVLDIGGNDGTLLSLIKDSESVLINIDAASNIRQAYEIPNYVYVNSKFDCTVYLAQGTPPPAIIFSIAVFYQLNDPLQFLRDVHTIMNEDSLFVLQMTYLESMYSNNIFDNVVHEHVTYFSLKSLMFIAELAGLKVLGARVVDSYGGSLRAYLVKSTSTRTIPELMKDTNQILESESKNKTADVRTLERFGANFAAWQESAGEFLNYQFKTFGPIIGMGASTKGNMILQALGITEETMPYIMDNNPKKIGSRTTGSFIPVVDETDITDLEINIMSLPYYYNEFFMKILKPRIKKEKFVEFITPLPKPKVVRIIGE
jgi:NDP-4-keto-2,6-dideoxyhexose 3-C-methyltransferase